jgi:putative methyltransferase (TIGR04325 family)
MIKIKQLARDWIPPAIVREIRTVRQKYSSKEQSSIIWDGDYTSWEEALAASTGYDSNNILQKVKESTLKVKRGEAVFERDSVIFDEIQYSWSVLAGLMWTAARHQGKLDVLDFGGSLGSSYFQNRKFLAGLSEVHWSVIEQPSFVDCGREYTEDDCLKFYNTIAECLTDRKPNVILLSSVLEYLESPRSILLDLMNVGADCLIIDRTPFLESETDRIVIQHVPSQIYAASYPSWLFSKSLIQEILNSNWNLLAKFDCPEGLVKSGTGIEFTFSGLIFQAR